MHFWIVQTWDENTKFWWAFLFDIKDTRQEAREYASILRRRGFKTRVRKLINQERVNYG